MIDPRHLQVLRQQLDVLTDTVKKLEIAQENGETPSYDSYSVLSRSLTHQAQAFAAQANVVHLQNRL